MPVIDCEINFVLIWSANCVSNEYHNVKSSIKMQLV